MSTEQTITPKTNFCRTAIIVAVPAICCFFLAVAVVIVVISTRFLTTAT